MTCSEFNKKYDEYLISPYGGLDIHSTKVIDYLDKYFEEVLIKIPNFKFYKIKMIFGIPRVYTNLYDVYGAERALEIEKIIETQIKKLINE